MTRKFFLSLICLLVLTFSSFAQQDPDDPYGPDSLFFTGFGSCVFDSTFIGKAKVSIDFVNDEVLSGVTVVLRWTGPVELDSISFVGSRVEAITNKIVEIDSVNRKIHIVVATFEQGYTQPGRGLLAGFYFTVSDTGFLGIDSTHWINGGLSLLEFHNIYTVSFTPIFVRGEFHIIPTNDAGDVNQDSIINLSDAIFLANYILKGGPSPSCYNCSDVDADCGLSIADVIRIARYIFYGVPIPWMGCVSEL